MPSICVVGSLVMDLVVWLDHLPKLHETQPAHRFQRHAGGKGLNQALTAKRCGAHVSLIGKIGKDSFGQDFLQLLETEDIDHRALYQSESVATSFAMPMILPSGDNSIILVPQANMALQPHELNKHATLIQHSDVLMLQLEIPHATSLRAAQLARQAKPLVILNPAPATQDISELLPLVDWLIPNEMEAATLSNMPVHNTQDALVAGHKLLERGVRRGVIVTLGALGAVCVTPENCWHVGTIPTKVMDTTGAGDAFCGAFATALANQLALADALRWASAAGAFAVSVVGASPSLPREQNIQHLLQQADIPITEIIS